MILSSIEEETLRIYRRDNFKGVTIKLNAARRSMKNKKRKSLMKLSIMLKRHHVTNDDNGLSKMKDIQVMPVTRSTSFDKN